jgi:hypothetical protein
VLSLIGIVAGFIVVAGMLGSKRMPSWTAVFLIMTVLTSVTGFFFPFVGLLPSHIVGVISLVVLAVAIAGLYLFKLAGASRWIYVVTAVLALYLNVFVLVVQAFLKVPFLHALAPTQSEPAFIIAQGLALIVMAGLGIAALRSFRPDVAPVRLQPI